MTSWAKLYRADVYTPCKLNERQKCYAMALIEACRLINEKAKERRISDLPVRIQDPDGTTRQGPSKLATMIDHDAIIKFVRKRGDQLVQIYGA